MKQEIIHSLTKDFESFAHYTDNGLEFWFARDLQHLLEYSKWENFQNVIAKAKTACEISRHESSDHFPDIRKTIAMPKNAEKEINDIMLTRYNCYLIAQNGDSPKEAIAFAQTYFAMQTRKAEIIAERISEIERIRARKKPIIDFSTRGSSFGGVLSADDKDNSLVIGTLHHFHRFVPRVAKFMPPHPELYGL